MKKIFVSVAFATMMFASCGQKYDDFEAAKYDSENTMERKLLTDICREAFEAHEWMSEENACEEYGCCWEYVPAMLRAKYESGATLSVDEMKAVLAGLESCPSYWDTLGENGARIDYDYYLEYGVEYFSPDYGKEID